MYHVDDRTNEKVLKQDVEEPQGRLERARGFIVKLKTNKLPR